MHRATLFRPMLATALLTVPGVALADSCTLPAPPALSIPPGRAPDGVRIPADAGPVIFSLNGSAIYPAPGSDGLEHLAFNFAVTNVTRFPVTIQQVEVLDAETHTLVGPSKVASLNGTDLSRKAYLDSATAGTADASFSNVLPPGIAAVLYFDVAVPRGIKLPHYVTLRLTSSLATGPKPAQFTNTGQPTPVSCRAPIVLAPPLKGPRWLDGNGCCVYVGPHRWVLQAIAGMHMPPEQFAIDFVQLGKDRKLYSGDITRPRNWPYYGVDIVAAGAGTVVEVVDSLPDEVPGKDPANPTADTAAGNHVIIDMGDQQYALYAHMKPGSIVVKPFERVAQGQRLGALGNSGNTDSPHLHFQVMDRPSALGATGLPFVFDTMTLTGRAQGTPSKMVDGVMSGAAAKIDTTGAGAKMGLMPLMMDVLDFR